MVPKNKYLTRAESKQTLSTFVLNKTNATLYPSFSPQAVLEIIDKDPVARGALTHFVDKCMEGDFVILKKDTWQYDRAFQQLLLNSFNFRSNILRKVFLLGQMYNNVFIEIVRKDDGSVKELNVLDSSIVEAITKPNGDLLQLKGTVLNPTTGQYPVWSEEDIVWIKFNDRSRGYAPVDLRAVWETILLKHYVRDYVSWLWKTGQYRMHYLFNNSSDQDIQNALAMMRKHDMNYQQPFIFKGEVDAKVFRDIKEVDSIDRLFKYLDNQILIAMRVPPNDAGIPDASGRSNADAQSNNLGTRITSAKTIVADSMSYDLFPKMNKGNNLLKFAPNDRYAEKQVFEVLQIMQSMNISKDVMKEYMIDKGVVFESDEWFVEPVVVGDAASQNPRNKDMMPSRLGKGTGEGNKPKEEVTTRPDQLGKE